MSSSTGFPTLYPGQQQLMGSLHNIPRYTYSFIQPCTPVSNSSSGPYTIYPGIHIHSFIHPFTPVSSSSWSPYTIYPGIHIHSSNPVPRSATVHRVLTQYTQVYIFIHSSNPETRSAISHGILTQYTQVNIDPFIQPCTFIHSLAYL